MSQKTRADLADVADDLLSRLTPPPPLSSGQIARIRANITDDKRKRTLRPAVIAALAIALGGSSALAMYGVAVLDRPKAAEPPAIEAPSPPKPRRPSIGEQHVVPATPRPEPVIVQAAEPVPVQAAEPVPPRSEPPATRLVRASPTPTQSAPRVAEIPQPASETPNPTVDTEPLAREGALGAESRLVAAALDQLRKAHDPKAALATLDRHAVEFPHGALADEARTARIEALLASGDKRSALALLDAITVGSELAVVRGELRLEAGRAEQAQRDFDSAVLGTNDAIEARALYGRAACRARLGDHAGARRDLEDYVRRFPHGKSANDARAAVERSR
jgi:TolA-binding protein